MSAQPRTAASKADAPAVLLLETTNAGDEIAGIFYFLTVKLGINLFKSPFLDEYTN
jgi:hypothetical protein